MLMQGLIIGAFATILVKLLLERSESVALKFLRLCARTIPKTEREDHLSEWSAVVRDTEGDAWKLITSIGFLRVVLPHLLARESVRFLPNFLIALFRFVLLLPATVYFIARLSVEVGTPWVLANYEVGDGKVIRALKFRVARTETYDPDLVFCPTGETAVCAEGSEHLQQRADRLKAGPFGSWMVRTNIEHIPVPWFGMMGRYDVFDEIKVLRKQS